MKTLSFAFTLLTGTMLLTAPAMAAGPGGLHEACQGDIHSFCSNIQPGGGRIIHCLQDHYKEVSSDCYTALEKRHNRAQAHDGYPSAPPPALPTPQGYNNGSAQPSTAPQGNGDGDAPPPPPQGGGNNPPPPDSGGQI